MRLLRVPAFLLLAASLTACASRSGTSAGGPTPRPFPGAPLPPAAAVPLPPSPEPPPASAAGAAPLAPLPELVVTALELRGTPYRWGGSDPAGFDCSGFVQWVFNAVGVRLPREVRDQFRLGHAIELNAVAPGDLLFFETENAGASHVGLAIGDGQFVHAPSSRGVVRVEHYGSVYWARRFVGARRVAAESLQAD